MPRLRSLSYSAALLATALGYSSHAIATEDVPVSLLGETIDLTRIEDAPVVDDKLYDVRSSNSRPFFVGGVEATFLAPIMSGTTAETIIVDNVVSDGVGVIDDSGLNSMTFAPRVWMGFDLGNGWGAVTRFWYLSDKQIAGDNIDLNGGQFGFNGVNALKQYTIDLELTRNFDYAGWDLNAALGVRYASIEYHAEIAEGAIIGNSLFESQAESDRAFSGTGVTFALGGRKAWARSSSLHWIRVGTIGPMVGQNAVFHFRVSSTGPFS